MTTAIKTLERPMCCDGALQIIRFNWRQYVAAFLVVLCMVISGIYFPFSPFTIACTVIAAVTLFWTFTSIFVSHWVYDRSGIRQWKWLRELLPQVPSELVNIHCGFDETSAALRRTFPASHTSTYDLFDSREMTEPSIAVAREASAASGIRCNLRQLPASDGIFDAALLLFAAHEIRRVNSREAFFEELKRIVKPGGYVIIVEHLRDAMNFVAFGPGVFHFLPRKAWTRLEAFSFRREREFSFTPFVRVFVFRRCI